jgi:hypothetical protein
MSYISHSYSKSNISSTLSDDDYILPIEQTNQDYTHKPERNTDSILNNIVQHPFIDTLSIDADSFTNSDCHNTFITCNIILYRIQHHNENHYVEFYLPFDSSCDSRSTIGNKNKYSITNDNITNDIVIKYLKEQINDIPGVKRLKGYVVSNNTLYSIVQVRDTTTNTVPNNNNWLTLWDIIAYKHVFREKIHHTIVDFFVKHHKLAYLFVNSQLCLLPMVLYCHVSKEYDEYVKKNKSIQYCQRETGPVIHLHSNCLCETNNIRNVCFIPHCDIVTSRQILQKKPYIILKNNDHSDYLFKNDDNILSYIK